MTERVFRYSETSTFLQSPRKYYLSYILNLERDYTRTSEYRPAYAADTGTIGHAALHAYYGKTGVDREIAMMNSVAELGVDPHSSRVQDARNAVDRYHAWLEETHADQGWEVVDTERRLSLDLGEILGDNVTLTGQQDLVVRDPFKQLHLVDYKFVDKYSSGAAYARQGLTYGLLAEHEYGQMPMSFILEQIARSKPKAPRNPFVPVNRTTVLYYTPEKLAEFKAGLLRTVEGMVKLWQEVEAGDLSGVVANPSWTCENMCYLFDICCGSLLKESSETAKEIALNYRVKESTPVEGDMDE